jgi:polyhydroxyalkanoate synthesis regulator phasin
MTFQEIKEIISKAGFSETAITEMNRILDAAIARGGITEEEKKKLVEMITLEMDTAQLEADIIKQLAGAFKEYGDNLEKAIDKIDEETKGEVVTPSSQSTP